MKYYSTCKKDKCPNWLGASTGFQCPNYYVNGWRSPEGEDYDTEDCAPIRTMLAVLETKERTVALQAANEEQRNTSWQFENKLATILMSALPGGPIRKELNNDRRSGQQMVSLTQQEVSVDGRDTTKDIRND